MAIGAFIAKIGSAVAKLATKGGSAIAKSGKLSGFIGKIGNGIKNMVTKIKGKPQGLKGFVKKIGSGIKNMISNFKVRGNVEYEDEVVYASGSTKNDLTAYTQYLPYVLGLVGVYLFMKKK